nr:glycosyltransferase [Thalassotalea sp. Y01]
MSVYNEYEYIVASIESILGQTYTDIELVLVDDSSSSRMNQILSIYNNHPKIKIIKNDRNIGLTASLNKALKLATGEYVARLDADDISLANRTELQVNFLDSNVEFAMVGGDAILIDENGNEIGYRKTENDPIKIKQKIYFKNMFIHPSVMIRRKVLEEFSGYNESKKVSQDYDLWFKLLKKYNGANLDTPLIKYRVREGSVTGRNNLHQRMNALSMISNDLIRLKPGWVIQSYFWGCANILKSLTKIILIKFTK